jgi:hypothetical protein
MSPLARGEYSEMWPIAIGSDSYDQQVFFGAELDDSRYAMILDPCSTK